MRLLRIDIDEFRSIEDEWFPADGLVVLFGPNSAGKTSVLEAAEQLITQAGTLRSDPGDRADLHVMGTVSFDLPAAGIRDSEDARTYRSLLAGEHSKPELFGSSHDPWAWLGKGVSDHLKDADISQIMAILAGRMADAGSAGTTEDRELLARSIFDPSAVLLTADRHAIHLWVHGPSALACRRPAVNGGRSALAASYGLEHGVTDGDGVAVGVDGGPFGGRTLRSCRQRCERIVDRMGKDLDGDVHRGQRRGVADNRAAVRGVQIGLFPQMPAISRPRGCTSRTDAA